MKTFPIALQTELKKPVAKIATCIRVVRTDGNVYGFTTKDRPLVIAGLLYESGFNPTDLATANNMDTDNFTAEGILSSDTITEDDLRAGRWDYFTYRRFQVNWAGVAMGEKKDSTGHAGEATVNRLTFIIDLLGLMEAYATAIGEMTQAGCPANLGDARCKVPLTGSPTMTVTGTIDSAVVTGTGAFFTVTDAARTEPADFFTEGVILFLDGQAAGLSYEIKEYTVGQMVTKTPIAYDVTGAAYTMHRGCRKRFIEDCRDTFNNTANFRGQPHLRGTDALVQVGRHSG